MVPLALDQRQHVAFGVLSIRLRVYGTLYNTGCIYVAANGDGFTAAYGFAPDLVAGTGGSDSNGDDQLALYNAEGVIVDFFGVIGEDGTDTCHEFEDGYAIRNTTAPDGENWNGANWTVYSDGSAHGAV